MKYLIIILALTLISCAKEDPKPFLIEEPSTSKVYMIETYGQWFNKTYFNDTVVYYSSDKTYQTYRTLSENDSINIRVVSDDWAQVKINVYYQGLILYQTQGTKETKFTLKY